MQFHCDACGTSVEYDPVGYGSALPAGWLARTIQWQRLVFCSACGGFAEFVGGMPAHLREMLNRRHGLCFDEDN